MCQISLLHLRQHGVHIPPRSVLPLYVTGVTGSQLLVLAKSVCEGLAGCLNVSHLLAVVASDSGDSAC
jgi:hypothetical protein